MNITDFLLARISEDEADARVDAVEMDRSSVSVQFDCATQARFTPARVLAECAVKREIISWWVDGLIGYVRVNDGELTNPLLPLAAVYASHPDYRQGWSTDAV